MGQPQQLVPHTPARRRPRPTLRPHTEEAPGGAAAGEAMLHFKPQRRQCPPKAAETPLRGTLAPAQGKAAGRRRERLHPDAPAVGGRAKDRLGSERRTAAVVAPVSPGQAPTTPPSPPSVHGSAC